MPRRTGTTNFGATKNVATAVFDPRLTVSRTAEAMAISLPLASANLGVTAASVVDRSHPLGRASRRMTFTADPVSSTTVSGRNSLASRPMAPITE